MTKYTKAFGIKHLYQRSCIDKNPMVMRDTPLVEAITQEIPSGGGSNGPPQDPHN